MTNIDSITTVILDNCSVKSNSFLSSAVSEMKKNMETVKKFIETYPSNEYSISGYTPRTGQRRRGKTYLDLNAQQRANFNSIVKIYNNLAK